MTLTPMLGRCLLAVMFLPMSETLHADYDDLVALFADWRTFESPPLFEGAPDYRAVTFDERRGDFEALRQRLHGIDISRWPVEWQVDWHIVRAEMAGYDFNQQVLRPWARDPAFYNTLWMARSDVPAHEGPTHHALVEVWTYEFPLDTEAEAKLAAELAVIPPLLEQARQNLTGNARDLWVTGIRDIRREVTDLDALEAMAGPGIGTELRAAIDAARTAATAFAEWLEGQAADKDGPSGIGRQNYSWYQQNVHLVPLDWEDEFRLLERELDRAWASLKLEEARNRELPAATAAETPAEYDARAREAVDRIMTFLEDKEIVTIAPYMRPALMEHLGEWLPEDQRHFFWITAHYDPAPLYTHFWHWFELARMDTTPNASPIRREPLLYNIFDSRMEGVATGVEEMFMHAGLYDDRPRSRELVWILLAQRAARGLGSLEAHANTMTMAEAGAVHTEWTPRGWMKTEEDLLIFEQHLYLRQPGYGTSYVTGKYLFERTLADAAKVAEEGGRTFVLKDFFDQLDEIGSIPMSLVRWQLTGLDDEIRPASEPLPPIPDPAAE